MSKKEDIVRAIRYPLEVTSQEYSDALRRVYLYVSTTDLGLVRMPKLARHFRVGMQDMFNFLEHNPEFNINIAIAVGGGMAELPLREQTVEVFDCYSFGC